MATRRKRTQATKPLVVVFNDLKMRERTLVHPDGSSLKVLKSQAIATETKWIAMLDKHPEFERA